MNVASCLADVVLSAHQFDKSTPVSISQFSSRMIQLVKGGPDILVDQLKARGVLLAGRALSEVCVQFGLLTLGNIGKEVDASYLIIGIMHENCYPRGCDIMN